MPDLYRFKLKEKNFDKNEYFPEKKDLENAEDLIVISGMSQTVKAYKEGKLNSLLPSRVGNMIVTTGRLGEQPLSELLGTSYLPILMPNSRAAFLFMNQAHRGCTGILHKSVPETLARSRAHMCGFLEGL